MFLEIGSHQPSWGWKRCGTLWHNIPYHPFMVYLYLPTFTIKSTKCAGKYAIHGWYGYDLHGHGCQKIQCRRCLDHRMSVSQWHFSQADTTVLLETSCSQRQSKPKVYKFIGIVSKEVMFLFGRCWCMKEIPRVSPFLRWRNHCGSLQKVAKNGQRSARPFALKRRSYDLWTQMADGWRRLKIVVWTNGGLLIHLFARLPLWLNNCLSN